VDGAASLGTDPVAIGTDTETGKEILLMNRPYGPYLQLGLPVEGDKKKPKRVSIPKEIPLADVNLQTANMLLSLPRDLGLHPITNKKVIANIGRFGPYVNHDAKFKSIPKSMSVFTINLDDAVTLLAQANTGPAPILSLGNHPTEDGQIEVYAGRYGPYVQHGKIRATLPKSVEPEALTLEEALELLSAKAAKEAPAAKKTTARKTSTAKTSAVKSAPAKKASTAKASTSKVAAKKPAAKKAGTKKA
jgi:DNA topoisomerase-1